MSRHERILLLAFAFVLALLIVVVAATARGAVIPVDDNPSALRLARPAEPFIDARGNIVLLGQPVAVGTVVGSNAVIRLVVADTSMAWQTSCATSIAYAAQWGSDYTVVCMPTNALLH